MNPPLSFAPRGAPALRGWMGTACLLLISGGLLAQEVTTITPARRAFLNELLTESQVLTEQYERALSKLEAELGAAADYEEALLVKQRRDELKSVYAQSGLSSTLAVPLLPEKARLTGTTEARGDVLTGWRSAGSIAEWSNVRLTPGSYYLELEGNLTELPAPSGSAISGRSQPQEKVSFGFYELSLLPGALENRRTFDITLSENAEAFTPIRIGPLNFTRSSITVRLVPASGYPGNLVRVRKLQLVPVQDDVIQAAPIPAEGDPLATAKDRMKLELETAQTAAISAYESKLKLLSTSAPQLREDVDAELQRLALLKQPSPTKPGELPLDRLQVRMGGMAGFEDMDGVKFVAESTNTGDQFMVEHAGVKFSIQLLWVRSAGVDDKTESSKAFAKHFGIPSHDVTAFARAASEFTLGYLEGKPLRLLLRPGKNKDGTRAALVFVPEVGLYQNVLIDQGLAAVQLPPKEARKGILERGMIGTLLEREATARRLKNGAWALSPEEKR